MTTTLLDHFKALPSVDDLRKWEEEHARMGVVIKELTEKRGQLEQLINVAAAIHGGTAARARGVGNANLGRSRSGFTNATWMTAIMGIAERHPDGLSYDTLKAEMPEPYASRMSRDNMHKSFYGALAKLEAGGRVKRYRGHLFTSSAFERHQARVAKGEISEVVGHDYRGSPMSDAVKAFLSKRHRATANEIKEDLCKVAEFREGLTRNSSAIYNLLKKLRERGDIIRQDDGFYSPPNENEAPPAKPGSASEVGEVDASPNENRPGLRVVG